MIVPTPCSRSFRKGLLYSSSLGQRATTHKVGAKEVLYSSSLGHEHQHERSTRGARFFPCLRRAHPGEHAPSTNMFVLVRFHPSEKPVVANLGRLESCRTQEVRRTVGRRSSERAPLRSAGISLGGGVPGPTRGLTRGSGFRRVGFRVLDPRVSARRIMNPPPSEIRPAGQPVGRSRNPSPTRNIRRPYWRSSGERDPTVRRTS